MLQTSGTADDHGTNLISVASVNKKIINDIYGTMNHVKEYATYVLPNVYGKIVPPYNYLIVANHNGKPIFGLLCANKTLISTIFNSHDLFVGLYVIIIS